MGYRVSAYRCISILLFVVTLLVFSVPVPWSGFAHAAEGTAGDAVADDPSSQSSDAATSASDVAQSAAPEGSDGTDGTEPGAGDGSATTDSGETDGSEPSQSSGGDPSAGSDGGSGNEASPTEDSSNEDNEVSTQAPEESSGEPSPPAPENLDSPANDNQEAPANDNQEAPANDNQEAPANDNQEAPANDNQEAPANDNQEAPASSLDGATSDATSADDTTPSGSENESVASDSVPEVAVTSLGNTVATDAEADLAPASEAAPATTSDPTVDANNDDASESPLPNLTQSEINQIETAIDTVAQVEGLLTPSEDALAGGGAPGAANLTTEPDSAQLEDAVADAIEAIESSAPNLITAAEGSLVPVAESVDQGVTEQLFVTDANASSVLGEIAEVLLAESTAGSTAITTAEVTIASAEEGTLVQVIHTSQFSPASPDPSGITYLPGTDRLFISDSEVDEMAIFQGVNLYEVTRTGTLTNTGATFPHLPNFKEPTGLGFNPADGTLFVSDDNRRRINMLRPGVDGRYGTPDDQQVGSIDVRTFGLPVDAEGVEFDTNSGHVFIADGVGREVWRVDPGVNGTFGDADDVVSHFDVEQYGALDPEGIGSVAARDNLVIVDSPSNTVYELTKTGQLVRTVSLSALSVQPQPTRLSGVTLAPGTNDPNRLNLWITARGVDNNANPNENDGRIFEISWPSAPFLTPPPPTTTLVIPVAARSDDAEEKASGAVSTGQAALDLVKAGGPQTVGLRFTGVTVPSGATVVTAYVQFQARQAHGGTTNLTIQGEASDNAATFSTTPFNISSRARTTAAAQWAPPPWTVGEAGAAQRTSDLSAVLEEIINRPGWASGNALALIITGSGRRVAEAFDGATAPVLHVEFTDSSGATMVASVVVGSYPQGPPVDQIIEEVVRAVENAGGTLGSASPETCRKCPRESIDSQEDRRVLRSAKSGDSHTRYRGEGRRRCRGRRAGAERRSAREAGRGASRCHVRRGSTKKEHR